MKALRPDCNTTLKERLELLQQFCLWRWECSSENPANYPEFDREWCRELPLAMLYELNQ
jgi:hypothetical protein